MNSALPTGPEVRSAPPAGGAAGADAGIRLPAVVTWRSVLLGLALSALTNLWIHWAELVLGGRGHTALANTSIPVGAFNVLFALVITNIILSRFLRPLAFSPAELLVIYVMMTVSTVISSSGGIHFIVPGITAAFYYANASNNWAALFHPFIPDWLAQKDAAALRGFYVGNAMVPWDAWRSQMVAWVGFMVLVALATLCLVSILRRQWIDRERLTFPTVAVPIQMMQQGGSFFSNRLLWIGLAIPFCINVMNTFHLNAPAVPYLPTRTAGQPDLVHLLNAPPWNAIGHTPISFYPFVIGIAYLLSVELTFSCWFFWLMTKGQAVFGAATGLAAGPAGGGQSAWPFIGHQGAGAFMALALIGLWLSRGYLREVWGMAFGRRERGAPAPDAAEPMSYRAAFIGLAACLAALVAWCVAAGMRPSVAIVVLLLALCYFTAAARIRAETGNAWLFGPDVDAYRLMTTTVGTAAYTPADLTVLAYLRTAIASFDLRCISMPNQFDAYRMADAVGLHKRRLTWALVLAIVLGTAASFAIALVIWYAFGAGAKTDSWRTFMGRQPFDQLADTLNTPVRTDVPGTFAVGAGMAITTLLMLLRAQFTWWVFHPVGYAIANTPTMNQVWLPFFIAWITKVVVLRYGGMSLYRRSLPFFFGVIVGDFVSGGLTTLVACLTGITAYPINW
ncbi:MAG TPA: DUF6785 family protein [Chthonomonadales bacterium]|nr:DUF6785 family protein [Chthonomonadales bacterium]